MLPKEVLFTGTQVNYYIICPTKLWLFSHFATMEQESDLVLLGKLLQEQSFQRVKKDIIVDQKIAVDFIRKGDVLVLHEVKKSGRMEKAHKMQLLYYIYYLRRLKGIDRVEGRIDYPKQRKTVRIELTENNEKELLEVLSRIKTVLSMKNPPKPERKKYCRKCSYFDFCWC